jgi:hypothetical protein
LPQKRIVDYQGRKVEGVVVEFDPVPEPWTPYELKDGSRLKLKLSLLEVVRLNNEFGPNGEPVYSFTAQNIINVDPAENLKRK